MEHLGLGDVSGVSQNEKLAAWALPRHRLLSLGKLYTWSVSEATLLCRGVLTPRWVDFLVWTNVQDQRLLREWKALTGQGQKPNSQVLLPESRGSLKRSMMEHVCKNPAL